MLYDHVIVWIDHREAHVQSFTRDESDGVHIKAHGEPRKWKPQADNSASAAVVEVKARKVRRFMVSSSMVNGSSDNDIN